MTRRLRRQRTFAGCREHLTQRQSSPPDRRRRRRATRRGLRTWVNGSEASRFQRCTTSGALQKSVLGWKECRCHVITLRTQRNRACMSGSCRGHPRIVGSGRHAPRVLLRDKVGSLGNWSAAGTTATSEGCRVLLLRNLTGRLSGVRHRSRRPTTPARCRYHSQRRAGSLRGSRTRCPLRILACGTNFSSHSAYPRHQRRIWLSALHRCEKEPRPRRPLCVVARTCQVGDALRRLVPRSGVWRSHHLRLLLRLISIVGVCLLLRGRCHSVKPSGGATIWCKPIRLCFDKRCRRPLLGLRPCRSGPRSAKRQEREAGSQGLRSPGPKLRGEVRCERGAGLVVRRANLRVSLGGSRKSGPAK